MTFMAFLIPVSVEIYTELQLALSPSSLNFSLPSTVSFNLLSFLILPPLLFVFLHPLPCLSPYTPLLFFFSFLPFILIVSTMLMLWVVLNHGISIDTFVYLIIYTKQFMATLC